MAGTHDVARAAGMKDTELKTAFSTILDMVKGGQRVLIKDFGTFEMKHVKERTITSPQIPGGSSLVPEHNVIKFRASPITKKVLNGEVVETEGEAEAEPAAEAPKAKAPVAAKPAVAKPANGVPKAPAAAKPAVAKPAAPAAAAKPAVAKPNTVAKKPTPPPPPAEDEGDAEDYDGSDA